MLGPPQIRAGRIEVAINPGSARRYFADRRYWVDYGTINLESLPDHIAVLPALGTVLPVAIATGVPVRVSSLDPTFADQVGPIGGVLRKMLSGPS